MRKCAAALICCTLLFSGFFVMMNLATTSRGQARKSLDLTCYESVSEDMNRVSQLTRHQYLEQLGKVSVSAFLRIDEFVAQTLEKQARERGVDGSFGCRLHGENEARHRPLRQLPFIQIRDSVSCNSSALCNASRTLQSSNELEELSRVFSCPLFVTRPFYSAPEAFDLTKRHFDAERLQNPLTVLNKSNSTRAQIFRALTAFAQHRIAESQSLEAQNSKTCASARVMVSRIGGGKTFGLGAAIFFRARQLGHAMVLGRILVSRQFPNLNAKFFRANPKEKYTLSDWHWVKRSTGQECYKRSWECFFLQTGPCDFQSLGISESNDTDTAFVDRHSAIFQPKFSSKRVLFRRGEGNPDLSQLPDLLPTNFSRDELEQIIGVSYEKFMVSQLESYIMRALQPWAEAMVVHHSSSSGFPWENDSFVVASHFRNGDQGKEAFEIAPKVGGCRRLDPAFQLLFLERTLHYLRVRGCAASTFISFDDPIILRQAAAFAGMANVTILHAGFPLLDVQKWARENGYLDARLAMDAMFGPGHVMKVSLVNLFLAAAADSWVNPDVSNWCVLTSSLRLTRGATPYVDSTSYFKNPTGVHFAHEFCTVPESMLQYSVHNDCVVELGQVFPFGAPRNRSSWLCFESLEPLNPELPIIALNGNSGMAQRCANTSISGAVDPTAVSEFRSKIVALASVCPPTTTSFSGRVPRKVFIDLHGESSFNKSFVNYFIDNYPCGKTFDEIIVFDPTHFEEFNESSAAARVNPAAIAFIKKAVFTKSGFAGVDKGGKIVAPAFRKSQSEIQQLIRQKNVDRIVEFVDISDFVANLSAQYERQGKQVFLVMKIDIASVPSLIARMVEGNTLHLINELFVQCYVDTASNFTQQRPLTDEVLRNCQRNVLRLRAAGVYAHEWY